MKTKTKARTAKVSVIHRGIVPSQNAMKYCAHMLRRAEHGAMRDAIVFERAEAADEANSLRLQAHDLAQVAQFIEERIINMPWPEDKTRCRGRKCK